MAKRRRKQPIACEAKPCGARGIVRTLPGLPPGGMRLCDKHARKWQAELQRRRIVEHTARQVMAEETKGNALRAAAFAAVAAVAVAGVLFVVLQ